MNTHRKTCLASPLWALCAALAGPAWADDPPEAPAEAVQPLEAGTVVVITGRPLGQDQVASVIDAQTLRRFDRTTVATALALLPGTTLATNSRNEGIVAVRGFDSRQVPLFIDGIPVYVPYDGYVDLNRFLTSDLAAIQVAKGFTSVVYGPNTLGGAINLVSRKPTQALEGDAGLTLASGARREARLNLGTRQPLWYAQLGAARAQADGFRLADGFVPTATEDGGLRNNADYADTKLSLKLGLTPNADDEYVLGYQWQHGEKGQPPSTDPAVARYWRWPYWNKRSLYAITRTALGASETLHSRLYLDRYGNEVDSYTDASYTTLKTRGSGSVGTGRSIYSDRSRGGALWLESTRLPAQTLRAVLHVKSDRHRETDANGTLNTEYDDTLLSLGAEDEIDLAPQWRLVAGAARQQLRPQQVFNLGNAYGLPGVQAATDVQAGLYRSLGNGAQWYATLARKSRLPTLKDRYSQRLGTYVQNPNLAAETALNAELGYQGQPVAGLTLEAALFHSRIRNKIQAVANVQGNLSQMQNVGEARSSGLELAASTRVLPTWELGGNYTLNVLTNVSDAAQRLTDAPRHKLGLWAVGHVTPQWDVIALAQAASGRWASNTVQLPRWATLDLKLAYRPLPAWTLAAGVTNLTDRNVLLADGFPGAGRTLFADIRYTF